MAIGMIFICIFLAVVTGKQHDKVRDQIRQRVHAVGDQGLRFCKNTDGNLGGRQDNIDHHADPGAFFSSLRALSGRKFDVFTVVVQV